MALENENKTYYLGIDGGGTNCRVKLESAEGDLLGIGRGGSANPSHGLTEVIQSILTAVDMAITQAQLPSTCLQHTIVGAGLAGLHLPQYQQLINSWQHPFKAFYTTDDLHIATLGAHNGKDGAVIIAGTGFSALSIVDNVKTPIGGYGFLQADYCSGSWIGYKAIQAVLLAHDQLGLPTQLTALIEQKYQVNGIELANRLLDAKASEYGALAPFVFQAAENNDAVATEILAKSSQFMSQVIQLIAATNPPRISLIGGIAEQLVRQLPQDITQLLSTSIDTPESGALCFARQQHLTAV